MNISYLSFGKSTDNTLSSDDIKNIKTLFSLLNGIVDFLSAHQALPDDLVNKFKSNQQNVSRILNFKGLEVFFRRHITAKETESLLLIIELSDEIINAGANNSLFLSGKEHVVQLRNLIKEISHNYQRWVKKPT